MTRAWREVVAEHAAVVAQLGDFGDTVERIIQTLVECLRGGGCVYVVGNGGSAADAQHIAAELLGRFQLDRQALPAVALTTDSSTLTAVANDLGFERVFARQVEGLVRPGDAVWLLSTSGNSPNVLEAARAARRRGAATIGFTGSSGGQLAELCTVVLRVPHSAAARIQEGHALAYHYICERVEADLAASGAAQTDTL